MLKELLFNKKSSIVSKWTEMTLDTYASESSKFLKSEKNQFSNPVGKTICKNISSIYDEIINNESSDEISSLLCDIIKIRAIQDFSPSQAVEFIFLLKNIIQDELENELKVDIVHREYCEFMYKIDKAALNAFDLYMECREKIHQIRINEIRYKLLKLVEPADGSNT
jgi:hypothetical protein